MVLKKRKEKPPKKLPYQKYKPYLRREFDHACCYCDSTEPEIGGPKRFHIDHYKPWKKFAKRNKNLKRDYNNLIYACPECNIEKRDYWPTVQERLAGNEIINPFIHHVDRDLNKANAKWVGKSDRGKFNIRELRLNSERLVGFRLQRVEIEEMIKDFEVIVRNVESEMQALLRNTTIPSALNVIEGLRLECESKRRKISALKAKIYSNPDSIE